VKVRPGANKPKGPALVDAVSEMDIVASSRELLFAFPRAKRTVWGYKAKKKRLLGGEDDPIASFLAST